MRPSPRFFGPILLGLAAVAGAPLALTDESENYRRLKDMPRERRVVLLRQLETFDKLDRAEQSKIRKLETEIASQEEVDELRYRSVMRRYELWLNGLSDEQQKEIRSIDDPESRLEKVKEIRKLEQKDGGATQRVYGIRPSYYGLMGPFEAAQLLRIWQKMSSPERHDIDNRESKSRVGNEIREINKKKYFVKPHPFPAADEKHYDAIVDANSDLKKDLRLENIQTRSTYHFTEFLYFENPEHKPKPVSQQNLEKFSNFCPTWFHAMTDPLSADDARNYLTIVYRLLFPDSEITADWKPAKEKAVASPAVPRPAAKRSGSPAPL